MGLLDGGIAAVFGAAFSGLYLDGTLHRGTGEPIYADNGDITGYTDAGDLPCKVQVDAATDTMRREDGYSEGDVRLLILASGIASINSDMAVTAREVRYSLQTAKLDAAASYWECRGRADQGG